MRKILTYFFVLAALFSLNAENTRAESNSDQSASVRKAELGTPFDYRVENLRNYLKKLNSPLAPYAQDFVTSADENSLDYRLIPAISGVESTFAKNIPYDSYNAYGWVNGNFKFASWPDSISQVSKTLKTGYIDKGAPTITDIAKRYAPPSTTWGNSVKYFVGKIDAIPLNFDI